MDFLAVDTSMVVGIVSHSSDSSSDQMAANRQALVESINGVGLKKSRWG